MTAASSNEPAACRCHLSLAIVSVPSQPWEKPMELETALCRGTVFESLDMPFFVGGEKHDQQHSII